MIGRRIAASTPAATPNDGPALAALIGSSPPEHPASSTHELLRRAGRHTNALHSPIVGGGGEDRRPEWEATLQWLESSSGRVEPEREWPACPTGRGKRVQCLPRGSLSDSRRPNEQGPNGSAPLEVSSRPCSATVPASQDEVGWAFVGGVEGALRSLRAYAGGRKPAESDLT